MPWIMHRVAGYPIDPERINNALPQISRALGFLEAELQEDGAWTQIREAGAITLADVFLYPIVRSLELTPQGEVGIAQCDHLKTWLDTLKNRPSIAATCWEIEKG